MSNQAEYGKAPVSLIKKWHAREGCWGYHRVEHDSRRDQMATIDGEHILFDTGKSIYVEGGTVAIGHGLSLLFISGADLPESDLTPEEGMELAQVMIDRWGSFRVKMERRA
jgi:hypothetical protein